MTAFSDRPEVEAFQAYLTSPEFVNTKIQQHPVGGWVSANSEQDTSLYASQIDALSAELAGQLGVPEPEFDWAALPAWQPRREIVHAVFPSRRGLLPSVRALLEHLAQRFEALGQD